MIIIIMLKLFFLLMAKNITACFFYRLLVF